jgi:hypothetical protein
MQRSLPRTATPVLRSGAGWPGIRAGAAGLLLGAVACAFAAGLAPGDRAAHCGSVVVIHCNGPAYEQPGAAADERDASPAGRQLRDSRAASDNPDEIVISGRRFRKATPREVFERNLGIGSRPPVMLTRNTADGMHCTTLGATGHRFCSIPGNIRPSAPGLDDHFSDWAF